MDDLASDKAPAQAQPATTRAPAGESGSPESVVGRGVAWVGGGGAVFGALVFLGIQYQRLNQVEAALLRQEAVLNGLARTEDLEKMEGRLEKRVSESFAQQEKEISRLRQHVGLPATSTVPPNAKDDGEPRLSKGPVSTGGVHMVPIAPPVCVDMQHYSRIDCSRAEKCFAATSFADSERAKVRERLGVEDFTPCYEIVPERIKARFK